MVSPTHHRSMRLTDHVYALPIELQLGDQPMTIYPVAIETPRGSLLLDAGPPGAVDDLADGLAEHGLAMEDVEYLLLTHQDYDHAGGAAAVIDAADPTVYAHAVAAPYVAGERTPLKTPNGEDRRYDPVPVDVELQGGERFRTRAGPLEVIFTPGHTPGHLSFYLPGERLLVTADAMNSQDGLGPSPDHVTLDVDEMRASIERLAELDVERIHCHHGGPIEANSEQIRDAVE